MIIESCRLSDPNNKNKPVGFNLPRKTLNWRRLNIQQIKLFLTVLRL